MALCCHKCIRQNGRSGVFSLTVKALLKLEIGCPILLAWHSLPACRGGFRLLVMYNFRIKKGGRNAAFFSDCAALMRRRISFGPLRLIHFPDKQVSVSEMVAHPRYENGTERADQK